MIATYGAIRHLLDDETTLEGETYGDIEQLDGLHKIAVVGFRCRGWTADVLSFRFLESNSFVYAIICPASLLLLLVQVRYHESVSEIVQSSFIGYRL